MFGISFGAKKQNSTESQVLNSTENTTQNQQQSGDTKTTGSQNTSQSTTGSSTGTSGTKGTTGTSQVQSGTQTQTGQTSNFDATTLAALTDSVTKLLGGAGTGAGADAANSALTQMGGFDAAGYVKGINDKAASDSLSTLQEQIGGANSAIGGTAATNSAAALLSSRLENNRASTLAGIDSQAQASAQDILAKNATAGSTAQALSDSLLTSLAQILKGGSSTTAGTAATTDSTTGATTTASNTQTAEQQAQTQNTNTTTVQDVLSQLSTLLKGTDVKSATSDTKGTNTQLGGGLSLSL